MLELFLEHIKINFPFLQKGKLLLANSAGLDSVVLTALCLEANLNISLAHCNFNLRGKESDGDEDFIIQLAEDLEVEVFVQHFDTKNYAEANKLSTQMAARNLRYTWFRELAKQLKFNYILTAHHSDDNLETFLINLSRGTGLDGLIGIPEINGNIVRPLLPFSREDIEAYAKKNKLKWREDSSNASTDYLRNKLRHDVIPTLKNITPNLLNNIHATQSHLKESQQIIKDKLQEVSSKILKKKQENIVKINIKELLKLKNHKVYIYQLFKEYGFTQWEDIFDLLEAQSGKMLYSESHRLLKDREELILTPLIISQNENEYRISSSLEPITYPGGSLHFFDCKDKSRSLEGSIYLDKNNMKFPLTLRKWKEGDYFYPLGMKGKKKLSKFFKDEKYSIYDKEQVWLLCSEGNIVWIVNKRIDERFKVTKSTEQVLKIAYSNPE